MNVDMRDFSEFAATYDVVARFHKVRRTAALRADLHYPAILPRRGPASPLPSAISTLMGFCTQTSAPDSTAANHGERVPVVRGCNLDDVEIFLLEHFTVIGEGTRLLPRSLAAGDDVGSLGEPYAGPRRTERRLNRRPPG